VTEPSPLREVRALYDEQTIRVYQAYSPAIALPALRAQRFVAPFKRERMTWIKPSFTWMAYRAGWGAKPGQEHILGIDITHEGFAWALAHSSISHYDRDFHDSPELWKAELQRSPVRIQWDPERDLRLEPLPFRSLQVGLSGPAVHAYVDAWIVRIEEVTPVAREIEALVARGQLDRAEALRPRERPYRLPDDVATRIGVTAAR
jgi:hypothetical protein